MNLQEFVRDSLLQITSGVLEAKQKNASFIAPKLATHGYVPEGQLKTEYLQPVFLVDFDVAVTVSRSNEGGAGGGVNVLSVLSVEARGKRATENSSVSRVKFNVPILYTL